MAACHLHIGPLQCISCTCMSPVFTIFWLRGVNFLYTAFVHLGVSCVMECGGLVDHFGGDWLIYAFRHYIFVECIKGGGLISPVLFMWWNIFVNFRRFDTTYVCIVNLWWVHRSWRIKVTFLIITGWSILFSFEESDLNLIFIGLYLLTLFILFL